MHRRKAFTMIELLIVVIIISVLAAIAVPRFVDTKRQAYVTAMKSDLRNIVSAAESHFSEDGTYALWPGPASTNGITLIYVGKRDSWSATATHPSAPGLVCSVERGPLAGTNTEPTCQ